jgi:hypothetical protein
MVLGDRIIAARCTPIAVQSGGFRAAVSRRGGVAAADAFRRPVDDRAIDLAVAGDAATFAVGTLESWHEHIHSIVDLYAIVHEHVRGAQAHDAADLLQHPVSFHFPWITAAVAGIAETRLLVLGHTTLGRAAKNTALSTGGVGTGGTAGKITGGALGGLVFGPPGALVGALLGGIGGAIGGRVAAKHVIREPLRRAQDVFDCRLAEFRAQLEAAAEDGFAAAAVREAARRERLLEAVRAEIEVAASVLRGNVDLLRTWSGVYPWARRLHRVRAAELSAWERSVEEAGDDIHRLGDALASTPRSDSAIERVADALIAGRAAMLEDAQTLRRGLATTAAALRAQTVAKAAAILETEKLRAGQGSRLPAA